MSSPNQNTVIINKEKCDKNNLYATINLDALNAAALELGGNAFKLWVYLAKNQNGYTFDLSRAAATKGFGIKKSTYYDNIAILKEKGYITEIRAGSNIYSFNEIPNSPKSGQNSSFSELTSPKSGLTQKQIAQESPKSGLTQKQIAQESPKSGLTSPKSGLTRPKSGREIIYDNTINNTNINDNDNKDEPTVSRKLKDNQTKPDKTEFCPIEQAATMPLYEQPDKTRQNPDKRGQNLNDNVNVNNNYNYNDFSFSYDGLTARERMKQYDAAARRKIDTPLTSDRDIEMFRNAKTEEERAKAMGFYI